jgi:hypothetical protein
LAHEQFLLCLLHLGLIVKLVQELARRLATRNFMPQHFREAVVLAQRLEILDATSAQRVQQQETLHVPGFIQSALPLFDLPMLSHAARHVQRACRLQEIWNAGIRRHAFF